MNSKSTKTAVWLTSFAFSSIFLLGCGASRQSANVSEEAINLDELLGEDEMSQASNESEQVEVLRLLGITPAEPQPKNADFTTINQEQDPDGLQADVDLLKQELSEKDKEITQLRSELTEREFKISDLESKTNIPAQNPSIPFSGQPSEPSPQFKSRYQNALNQFKTRSYNEAISLFSELLLSEPNNSLADNCQYWIGECYYGLENYNQAVTEFEKIFSFPNSNKSDDAQLKLGLCYVRLGDMNQARAEFDRLLAIHPNSEYVSLAQKYIAEM